MDAMLKYTLPYFAAVAAFAQVQQQEAKLPAPYATPTVNNFPKVVGRPSDAQLKVPRGFEIEEYATDFNTPRFMYTGPSGEILVSDSSAGTGYVLVDKNKSYYHYYKTRLTPSIHIYFHKKLLLLNDGEMETDILIKALE